MQDVVDLQLDKLSLNELRELNENIESAIRAAIRQRSAFKAQATGPAAAAPPKVDLERERDAWIAAKRSSKLVSSP